MFFRVNKRIIAYKWFMSCVRATAEEHDSSRSYPQPFYKAAQRLCLKNGWHLGSFLLSMYNNLAFCEHRSTRLTPEVGRAERHVEESPIYEHVAKGKQTDYESQWPKRGITSRKLKRPEVAQAVFDIMEERGEPATFDTIRESVEQALELKEGELKKHQALIEAIVTSHNQQALQDMVEHCVEAEEDKGDATVLDMTDDQSLASFQAFHNWSSQDLATDREAVLETWGKYKAAAKKREVIAVVAADYVHETSPGIMVLLGGAASSRKTSNFRGPYDSAEPTCGWKPQRSLLG